MLESYDCSRLVINTIKINNTLYFCIGLFSLFFIPYVKGVRIVDLLVVSLVAINSVLFIINPGKKKLNVYMITVLLLMLLYYGVSCLGAVINTSSGSYMPSLLVAMRYSLLLIPLFSEHKDVERYLNSFLKGFIYSALLSTIWMIIDHIYYFASGTLMSINENIFGPINIGVEHGLTNRYILFNMLFLRGSGFGWDPGGMGPPLVISFILAEKKWVKNFLFIGILLTISKTAILVLITYLVYKVILKHQRTIAYLSIVLFLLLVFYMSFKADIHTYTDDGTYRHIKYFSQIFNLALATPKEVLLGYGFRGTGEFLVNYGEPDITHSMEFHPGSIPESTFTNLFLYAGLFGIMYHGFLLTVIFVNEKSQEYKNAIIFLFLLYLGYTFENIWSVLLINLIFLKNFHKQISRLHEYRCRHSQL